MGCWLLAAAEESFDIAIVSREPARYLRQWERIVSNARRVLPDMEGPSMRTGMPLLSCSTRWF